MTSASESIRHALGVAVAVLAVAALTAAVVVSPKADASARTTVRLAAARMDEVSSFRVAVAFLMRTGNDTDGLEFRQHGEGIFDVANRRGRLTMQLAPAGDIEILTIDDVVYVRWSGGEQPVMPTPWIAVPLPQAAVVPSGTASIFGGAVALEQLRRLTGSGEVEDLGADEVRGAATMRYRIRLAADDLRRLAREAGVPPDAEASLPEASGSLMELDIWIDDDLDLVRRQRVTLRFGELPGVGGMANTLLTTTTDFFDFGVAVPPIDPPPEDQVTRAPDPALVPTAPRS